jgi:hypothetical protein
LLCDRQNDEKNPCDDLGGHAWRLAVRLPAIISSPESNPKTIDPDAPKTVIGNIDPKGFGHDPSDRKHDRHGDHPEMPKGEPVSQEKSLCDADRSTRDRTTVKEIESVMDDLRARGVEFLEYYMGEMGSTENGLMVVGQYKAAWFKDSEGNIIELSQVSPESGD